MLQVGQQVGNYKIVGEIAQGTNANVYKATHNVLTSRVVALKLLHTPFPGTEHEANNILYQEARLLEHLKHPHILALVDYGVYEHYPYIVKEYAPAGSLRDRLRRLRGKAMPYAEAMAILQQVGEGLAFAHEQRIVHCDLKPENILFHEHDVALIADFDIARVLKTVTGFAPGLGGTPSYMSPEQFKGKVCCASDQYALACMAYEMLTGQRPFQGQDANEIRHAHLHQDPTPPTQINPTLPQHVDQALLRALEKEADRRFASVTAFMQALDPGRSSLTSAPWSAPTVQAGQRLVLHQRGTPAAEFGDEIFYEATVVGSPEVTEAIVRHRASNHSAKQATPETASRKKVAATPAKTISKRVPATAAKHPATSTESKATASSTKSATPGTRKKTATTEKETIASKKKLATAEKETTTPKKKATTTTKASVGAKKEAAPGKKLPLKKASAEPALKPARKKTVKAE